MLPAFYKRLTSTAARVRAKAADDIAALETVSQADRHHLTHWLVVGLEKEPDETAAAAGLRALVALHEQSTLNVVDHDRLASLATLRQWRSLDADRAELLRAYAVPPIPGLDVNRAVREQIWRAFARWSHIFRLRLEQSGVPLLVKSYRDVVESVETESCRHTDDGSLKTGDAWRYCCGISYEYTNDIACRGALAKLQELAGEQLLPEHQAEVAALDLRLRSLLDDPLKDPWWMTLPRTVAP